MNEVLKPCPWCGRSSAKVSKFFWVDGSGRADHYEASCVFGCGSSTKELTAAFAIASWNARPNDPAEPAGPELAAALKWLLASIEADPADERHPDDHEERLALAKAAARKALAKAQPQ